MKGRIVRAVALVIGLEIMSIGLILEKINRNHVHDGPETGMYGTTKNKNVVWESDVNGRGAHDEHVHDEQQQRQ